MTNETLTDEIDDLRSILSHNKFSKDKDDKALMTKLQGVLCEDGPNVTYAGALDTLRDRCERGWLKKVFGISKTKEADGIISMAGSTSALNKKAAALKTLRHLRLMSKRGGQNVWLLTLPKSYRHWASDQFDGLSKKKLIEELCHVKEYHSDEDKRNLQWATQEALAWSLKAAASVNKKTGENSGEALIKRWFADEDHQDEAGIKKIARELASGYGKIAAAANSSKLILTDRPEDRGTSWDTDTEAFVYKSERLKVIYCEGDFFGNQNTLKGKTNWARIIVHELSHIQLKTDDVETHGNPRYAWHPKGIGPKKGEFSTDQALNNADNWAWYAADAAGALTQKNRNDALQRP